MRQKIYYTADEIETNLYTSGGEWMTIDGREYIGLYHKYITNEVYTQPTWNIESSKKLIKYSKSNPNVSVYKKLKPTDVKYKTPKSSIIQVTPIDRKNGYIQRYFLKKINENSIIEVNKQEYDAVETNASGMNMYDNITLEWRISGNLDDSRKNGIYTRGVITTNRLTVERAEEKMPGISNILQNYTEFYLSDNIVIPKDINE